MDKWNEWQQCYKEWEQKLEILCCKDPIYVKYYMLSTVVLLEDGLK